METASRGTRRRDDPRIRFGRRVALLRKRAGLSQEGLSLSSGLARSYLGGVERGDRNIALINICRLAAALDVSPARLFEDDWATRIAETGRRGPPSVHRKARESAGARCSRFSGAGASEEVSG